MKHTPTPWHVVLDVDGFANIVSPNADGNLELMIAECYGPQELQEANAAFITLACNTHTALVSALQRVENVLTARQGSAANGWPDEDRSLLADIRHALRLARGEE